MQSESACSLSFSVDIDFGLCKSHCEVGQDVFQRRSDELPACGQSVLEALRIVSKPEAFLQGRRLPTVSGVH